MRPSGSRPSTCVISRQGRPTMAAANGPISLRNSSGPREKRSSRSVCHVKCSRSRFSSSVIGSVSKAVLSCVSACDVYRLPPAARVRIRSRSCSVRVRRRFLPRQMRCLLRTHRTARIRRALRAMARVAHRPGRGRAWRRREISRSVVTCRRRGRLCRTHLRTRRGGCGNNENAVTAIKKIDPRTGASREHAGRCAEAAQPLHAHRAVGIEAGARAARSGAGAGRRGQKFYREAYALRCRIRARPPHWPKQSARRRPATARPVGCFPQAPPRADRSHCTSSIAFHSSTSSIALVGLFAVFDSGNS